MIKHRTILMVVIGAGFVIMQGAAYLAGPPQTNSLSPAEQRGQEIYLKGTSPSGSKLSAFVTSDGIEIPGSALACAGCHGRNGLGSSEAGVTPSPLTWASLTRPYVVTSASGRKHPAYDEARLKRAITMGLDPAGNRLQDAMPRFRMALQDMDDLIAYMKRMGSHFDPGVTQSSIVVGSLIPAGGQRADIGAAVRSVIEAYVAELNQQGGVFGRKLELQFVDSDRQSDLKALAASRRVFALVSPVTAGADKDVLAMFEADEMPVVGPISLLPDDSPAVKRHVFYLFSPLPDQVRTLFTYGMQSLKGLFTRIAVVSPDTPLTAQLPAVVEAQCKKLGLKLVAKRLYREDQFDAAQIADQLRAAEPDCVFSFGSSKQQVELTDQLDKLHWTPNLMLLGSLAGKEMFDFAPAFNHKVFAAYPTLPSDRSAEGLNKFLALARKYKFAAGHLAVQLSAYCAAEVLVQGLKLAGRDLTRDGLINGLETLYDFNTGLIPRLTYGQNRHIGALGAYIVTVDSEKKQLIPVSGWLMPN